MICAGVVQGNGLVQPNHSQLINWTQLPDVARFADRLSEYGLWSLILGFQEEVLKWFLVIDGLANSSELTNVDSLSTLTSSHS
jgi:hypothetical protein